MRTIHDCLAIARDQFHAISDTPRLDSELLLSFVLEKPRSYLIAHPEKKVSEGEWQQFDTCLHRRLKREPIPYIIGFREFWSRDFIVTKDTLIPRPETEILVEQALRLSANQAHYHVVDLGTGSGAIALSLALERPTFRITATDISENALIIAKKNAQRFSLTHIDFYQGSWCDALPRSLEQQVDMIVSNPPYIAETEWAAYADGLAFEPYLALVSSHDGLTAIKDLCQSAKRYLKPTGYLLVEHGFLQGQAVRNILTAAAYQTVHSISDLSGHERATIATPKS